MLLRLYNLRFRFTAGDAVHFPAETPANLLRGGLGLSFRRLACTAECSRDKRGAHREGCLYAHVFEPSAVSGPSGLADPPRPFVFRAAHLGGLSVRPGQEFHFDVHIFDPDPLIVRCFILAFVQLADEGMGRGRRRARLKSVEERNEASLSVGTLYDPGSGRSPEPGEPLALDLQPSVEEVHRLVVRFLTPTELKVREALAPEPEFAALFARARDRVSTLMARYQNGPADVDFQGLGRAAEAVRMVRCEIAQRSAERRSSRTGQSHSIGGFVGEAEYEGGLRAFVPFLRAAQWTGVGRHTVWGNGQIEISPY